MLYEVITFYAFFQFDSGALGINGGYLTGNDSTFLVIRQVLIEGIRITSYNVCYTKLLRMASSPCFRARPQCARGRRSRKARPQATNRALVLV